MNGEESYTKGHSEKTAERCPCCMGFHMPVVITMPSERNIVNGKHVTYKAVYSYCPFTYEYYQTEEQLRKNTQAQQEAYKAYAKYISQEKMTELLLKFEERKGEECTNVFIALHGQ